MDVSGAVLVVDDDADVRALVAELLDARRATASARRRTAARR